jgi:hypothetical protein
VLVADLRHFLDVDDATPTAARRLAEQLTSIVRAATARPAGEAWTSALGCNRRPGRHRCPGPIALRRAELPSSIEWECVSCGDAGTISGWEGSAFDLRTVGLQPAAERTVHAAADVAETLRSVMLLDVACERMVFGARMTDGSVLIEGTNDDFDTLIESVAAEGNHEPNRRRQRQLDAAYDALA